MILRCSAQGLGHGGYSSSTRSATTAVPSSTSSTNSTCSTCSAAYLTTSRFLNDGNGVGNDLTTVFRLFLVCDPHCHGVIQYCLTDSSPDQTFDIETSSQLSHSQFSSMVHKNILFTISSISSIKMSSHICPRKKRIQDNLHLPGPCSVWGHNPPPISCLMPPCAPRADLFQLVWKWCRMTLTTESIEKDRYCSTKCHVMSRYQSHSSNILYTPRQSTDRPVLYRIVSKVRCYLCKVD